VPSHMTLMAGEIEHDRGITEQIPLLESHHKLIDMPLKSQKLMTRREIEKMRLESLVCQGRKKKLLF